MTIYRITRDGEKNIFRRSRWIVMIFSNLSGLLLFSWWAYDQIVDLWVTIIIALFYFTLGNYTTNSYFRKLEEQSAFAEYELGEDSITFRQMHRPDLRISRAEISRISERNGLKIHTENILKSIFIPDNIIGFGDIKTIIGKWGTFEETNTNWIGLLIAPIWIILSGIIVTFTLIIIAPEIWEVTLLGMAILVGFSIILWITIQRVDLSRRNKQFTILQYIIFIVLMLYILFDIN